MKSFKVINCASSLFFHCKRFWTKVRLYKTFVSTFKKSRAGLLINLAKIVCFFTFLVYVGAVMGYRYVIKREG